MTRPTAGFPSEVNVGPIEPTDVVRERAAATYVTDQLGHDCKDILEALGMLPYWGNDTRNVGSKSKPTTPAVRFGTLR